MTHIHAYQHLVMAADYQAYDTGMGTKMAAHGMFTARNVTSPAAATAQRHASTYTEAVIRAVNSNEDIAVISRVAMSCIRRCRIKQY